jgi:hypothetical protein
MIMVVTYVEIFKANINVFIGTALMPLTSHWPIILIIKRNWLRWSRYFESFDVAIMTWLTS